MSYGPPPPPPGPRPGGWQQPQQPPAWQQQHDQYRRQGAPQQGGWQQQPPQPQRPPAPQHYGPATEDDRSWALMSYIGQFVAGAIAPAVVYLGRARTPFVRRHAAQALNMGIASVAVWVVGLLLMLLMEQLILVAVLYTAVMFAALVWAARAANRGEFRQVPAVLAWPLVK
ncbi:DUF4870 domain-containing protein [Actinomadura parmotrematis]|uniref:DUF4870 domain-containing protein n=1 Tax=Actinomadura parmotrematis TaxID=2864039 RepID=A0ABS7FUC2_9ACTN|nr:DUF4870 domain-containing protein [Actinomadura parmotrematis]MBW8483555.1 DUF4870 domain-containing protein [Actinomadura parmotrematis]